MFHSAAEPVALASAPYRQPDRASIRPTRFGAGSEDEVLALFLGLATEQRLARFGAPVSDRTIRAWRSTIDRAYYRTVACERGHDLIGLVELFGSRAAGWKRPELALTVRQPSDSPGLNSLLLEFGLGAARELGAVDVLVYFPTVVPSAEILVLSRAGTLDHDSGIAIIPCDAAGKDEFAW
jgi:hypothetical protein